MILTIFCTDKTKQRVNLHDSFTTEMVGKDRTKHLTRDEINRKALMFAVDTVQHLYFDHKIDYHD